MVATFSHQALGPSNWVTGRKHIENVYVMQGMYIHYLFEFHSRYKRIKKKTTLTAHEFI